MFLTLDQSGKFPEDLKVETSLLLEEWFWLHNEGDQYKDYKKSILEEQTGWQVQEMNTTNILLASINTATPDN